MNTRTFHATLITAVGLALTTPAFAQDAAPDPAPTEAPAPQVSPPEAAPRRAPLKMPNMEHVAADALARAALTRLRSSSEPSPDDYRITARVLGLARRVYPDDEELARLELQAWLGTEDEQQVLRLTREIVRLDPKDTVSQLRLITNRIRNLQDAEQRLAAFDRMLGDEGASLDASIRSRLALDAALLARETGDEQAFVERLTQATTLDNTNKDAAALYSTYFIDRTNDAVERADLLANIILADPNDMQAHTNLARELFRKGAYAGARRFMKRAGDIAQSGFIEPSVADLFDRYVLVWMTDGDEEVLRAIMGLQHKSLAAIRDERRRMDRQGIDTGEEPEPTIPHEIELIRLAIAWTHGDDAAMAEAARRIVLRFQVLISILDHKQPPYQNVTPEEDQYYRDEAKLQRATARLWAGVELDEAKADIEPLLQPDSTHRLGAAAESRLRGMIALREGDLQQAEQLLTAAGDDPTARLALGILQEKRGNRAAAIRAYASLALDHAHRMVGCAAKRRIEVMLGKPLPPTPDVEALETWAKNFAPWLDEITSNPSAFMTLTVEHVNRRIDPFGRIELRISLRNGSRVPMSVGRDLTINSRLLISPRVIVKGEDVSQVIEPEILDFDRRLRLMPGEAITAIVWASRGSTGVWLTRFADKSAAVRWRAIQGYRIDSARRFAPGLISVTAQSDMLERDPITPDTDQASIINRLGSAKGADFLEAMLQAIVVAGTQNIHETDEMLEKKQRTIGAALAARIPSLSSLEKAWSISVAERVRLLTAAPEILAGAQDDPSPLVQAALVIDGYTDPDDPGLVRLSEDPDPELRDLGLAARRRLRGGNPHLNEPPLETIPETPPAESAEP
ncbi:MAG: hypothetical protein JNK58_03305 [Phycisphaerae bacterium]|nr:hypothetical protein [Phycisphaerae bacterium]